MSTSFRLYNTISRSVEEVEPAQPGRLSFYSCGPTVYSYAHIGNFRSFVTADLIYRTARAIGWNVNYATNVTDVGHLSEDDLADASGEDRMVRALHSSEGEQFANIWDLARHYTQEMLEDWRRLNLLEPTVRPRASEHMREQILAVEMLVQNGHAYETEKGIYFSVDTFPEYGALSGNREASDLAQAVRDVVSDPEKRDPRDFALWKKDERHLMQWHSPWGWGFPGWHLECSVMAQHYLGEQIDIHAGGEDLIFPHHECEIAQAESLTGKRFASLWVHTRFLQLEGEKMAKSSGNYFTLSDLANPESEGGRGIDPLAVRLTLLSGQYRKPFNFTFDTLKANVRHRERMLEALQRIDEGTTASRDGEDRLGDRLSTLYRRALDAMLDDLNTPEALAATYEGVRFILSHEEPLSSASAASGKAWLDNIDNLLGVVHPLAREAADEESSELADRVEALLQERSEARTRKDFERADEIRAELEALGVEIKDTPEGPKWKLRSPV